MFLLRTRRFGEYSMAYRKSAWRATSEHFICRYYYVLSSAVIQVIYRRTLSGSPSLSKWRRNAYLNWQRLVFAGAPLPRFSDQRFRPWIAEPPAQNRTSRASPVADRDRVARR